MLLVCLFLTFLLPPYTPLNICTHVSSSGWLLIYIFTFEHWCPYIWAVIPRTLCWNLCDTHCSAMALSVCWSVAHWTVVSSLRTEMLSHDHCSYIPVTASRIQLWLGFSYGHFSACLFHHHTQQSSFSLRANSWHTRQSDLKNPGMRSEEQPTETCTQWGWWTRAMATDRIRTAKKMA